MLVHEHILVDFAPADQIRPGRYNADEVFDTARPRLQDLVRHGCRRLQECTPNYLGRDPRLLARLSDATGLEIWTNTGLYAAGERKHLPDFARNESSAQLAARWVAEARQGVDGITPRFIKIGVNNGPLHPLDRKIVEAAALASRETGLTIAAHTEDGKAALEELEIIVGHGLNPSRFVWVHAQNEKDQSIHERVASAGAWVEFDGISQETADWHVRCVQHLADRKLLNRVLVSQDSGWYHVGEPKGGAYNGYTYLYTGFLPKLPAAWHRQLLVVNPVQAFGS